MPSNPMALITTHMQMITNSPAWILMPNPDLFPNRLFNISHLDV